ncbi:phosphoribosylformylglycinamidine synthase subunit PurQ [Catalinimonas alkaloidigena]|nr:phosphoribosylformylglycinamidine synthase subunit PurQ [Catalinimonas alkaloidigena]
MKFGVVIFPGSNCDEDMVYVLSRVMQLETVRLWHKDTDLQGCDVIVLPGGFSYGDYLRSGAIARFSPIMEPVIAHAQNGGMLMGICNGFQILTEAGLVPGALLRNVEQKFICKNVYIRPQTDRSPLTAALDLQKAYKIPVAHAEGRYYADEATLRQLNENDQILFRYCDASGQLTPEANMNGSIEHIAGVCNAERNVFGMMPHPERAADEALSNTDGRALFESVVAKALQFQS